MAYNEEKEFTVDHLTKQRKRNKGELPQYYAEETHPAIISLEVFQKTQERIELNRRRSNISHDTPKRNIFTGMIVCGNCGKNYRRKSTRIGHGWNCATYLKFGKAQCHTKQIPEDALMEATAAILGLDEFDEQVFRERVREIIVPAFNHLTFKMNDGSEAEYQWEDRSRRESWTPEMRLRASEHGKNGKRRRE